MDRPGVRWRHDVDYDPTCALEMAAVELSCHVRSTYFIRARGPYNPFSIEVRGILHGIQACGHQLGIHVDLELSRDTLTPDWLLERATLRDYKLLSSEYTVSRQVSFHAPPRDVYWRDVPGFEHALHRGWKDRVVSDSRGVWHGDPDAMLAGNDPVALSLHPEWWHWPQEKADEWRVIEAAKP